MMEYLWSRCLHTYACDVVILIGIRGVHDHSKKLILLTFQDLELLQPQCLCEAGTNLTFLYVLV